MVAALNPCDISGASGFVFLLFSNLGLVLIYTSVRYVGICWFVDGETLHVESMAGVKLSGHFSISISVWFDLYPHIT